MAYRHTPTITSVPSSVLGSPSSTPVCVRVGHPVPRIVALGEDCRKRQNLRWQGYRSRPGVWTPRLVRLAASRVTARGVD